MKFAQPFEPEIGALTFQISLINSWSAVRAALQQIRARLEPAEISSEQLDDLEVVMAEVLNNIVEHAYPADKSGQINVWISTRAGIVSCWTCDAGAAMTNGVLPNPPRQNCQPKDLLELREGGFGWSMIHDLTQGLSYSRQDGQNLLHFKIIP
jgi:serine/threonine-protein kinase RsbW